MLHGAEMDSRSDEEDQNITAKKLKIIVINLNGNKVAVLIIDIM